MNEEILDKIGELAEQLDNSLFALTAMPNLASKIHVEGLSGTMFEVRDELAQIYKDNGGDEDLNLQAQK